MNYYILVLLVKKRLNLFCKNKQTSFINRYINQSKNLILVDLSKKLNMKDNIFAEETRNEGV